jgi:hypothetical protein
MPKDSWEAVTVRMRLRWRDNVTLTSKRQRRVARAMEALRPIAQATKNRYSLGLSVSLQHLERYCRYGLVRGQEGADSRHS